MVIQSQVLSLVMSFKAILFPVFITPTASFKNQQNQSESIINFLAHCSSAPHNNNLIGNQCQLYKILESGAYSIFYTMMAQRKDQKSINEKAVLPMTIHQIQKQLKNDVTFEGQTFHTVSIVGRLESFRRETRYNMLLFTDGTGSIEGQINMQDGKMPPYAQGIPFDGKQGDYFFVILKPKIGQENRKFYVHMIKQMGNYNQMTKHLSDIVLSHLVRTKH